MSPSWRGGGFPNTAAPGGRRGGWEKPSAWVRCATAASRCWAICGSSWCAICTPAAPHTSAARRHSVTPPPSEASKLTRSEEHTSELQSLAYLVCRLLLEKKKYSTKRTSIDTAQ